MSGFAWPGGYIISDRGWARPEQRGTATVSDARSKLVILGIGDDGLAGLTEPARRLLMEADLILGAPPILSLLEGVPARKEPLEPDMSLALRQVREALTSSPAGAGQRRRPAVLRRGALPLRPAGQGPLRGRAARQQHATGLRPDQGELGGRLPDQPGRPADRGGRSTGSGRRRRSACSPATSARRRGWPGSCWTGGSTTSGPTSARTWARPTSGSPRASCRPGRRWTSTRSTW